jgi:steroid delta-isomerase-like uncharacterized protein
MTSERGRAHSPLGLEPSTQLVQGFYERIWNAGDLEAARELLAESFAFRGSLGEQMRGREPFCAYVRSVRKALTEYRCDILECVVEGPKAFAKMRFSGIHVGPFRGYAPTGRPVEWLGAALFRCAAGRIAELWVLGDLDALDRTLRTNAERGPLEP